MYKKGCDLNKGSACSNLGYQYANGIGIAQDIQKANELFKKGCDLNEGTSCANLGIHYANGIGLKQDEEKALHTNMIRIMPPSKTFKRPISCTKRPVL